MQNISGDVDFPSKIECVNNYLLFLVDHQLNLLSFYQKQFQGGKNYWPNQKLFRFWPFLVVFHRFWSFFTVSLDLFWLDPNIPTDFSPPAPSTKQKGAKAERAKKKLKVHKKINPRKMIPSIIPTDNLQTEKGNIIFPNFIFYFIPFQSCPVLFIDLNSSCLLSMVLFNFKEHG